MTDPTGSVRRPLAVAGWVALAAALTLGVPLFLQMPPWTDLTLYQTSADAVLRGGVLYRDVFDTNLPGFVALLTVLQAVCGPDAVAVRAADLVIVGVTLFTIARWARRCGAGPAGEAWLWAGGAWFYLFTTEFSHCQRDVWLLLPAAAAALGRARRVAEPGAGAFGKGFAEGLIWGVAVWIKPHVVVPALSAVLAGLPFALRSWGRRGVLLDAAGLLAGGLALGAAGVGLLVLSGAWGDFVEVMTKWNPAYTARTFAEFPDRRLRMFDYFPPWGVLLVPAGLVCLAHALEAAGRASFLPRWLYRPAADGRARAARLGLAAVSVAWFGQALVLQRDYEYVHVPETLLALALLAGQGWPAGLPVLAWLAAAGAFWGLAGHSRVVDGVAWRLPYVEWLSSGAPAGFDRRTFAAWPDCFGPPSPELRDRTARLPHVCCTASWVELERVAAYLESVEPAVGDGDVLAFHDSPHPIYLRLGVRPGCRFMHLGTACGVPGMADRVGAEVRAGHVRYVVSDLGRVTQTPRLNRRGEAAARGALAPGWPGELDLPAWMPVSQRGRFPWDQPVVFRAGRYCVHRVTRPVGEVGVPEWYELDTLGPGLR